MNTLNDLLNNLPAKTAHAHCDVPCGVYETDSMKWAAETCFKLSGMLEKMEMPVLSGKFQILEFINTFARAVAVKEEYAEICKRQALILWTDYFKPEHLERWSDLHDKVWKLTKQCSIVKRNVSSAEAAKLKEMVAELSEIFADSKK